MVKKQAENHFKEIATEFEWATQQGNPCFSPERLYHTPTDLLFEMNKCQSIDIQSFYNAADRSNIKFSVVDNAALQTI